jgi:hypothetical protein
LCCILVENNLLLGIQDLAAKKKKEKKTLACQGTSMFNQSSVGVNNPHLAKF